VLSDCQSVVRWTGPTLPPLPGGDAWLTLYSGSGVRAGDRIELWCLDVPGGQEWLVGAARACDEWMRERGWTLAEGGCIGTDTYHGQAILTLQTALVPWP
jgi:hypothetical protein